MEQIWEKIHDSIDSYFESKHMFNITCSVITFLKRTCYNSSLYLDSEFENSIFVFDRILKFDFCVLSKLNIRSFVFDLIWKIDFCVLSNFNNRFLCLSAAYLKKTKSCYVLRGSRQQNICSSIGALPRLYVPACCNLLEGTSFDLFVDAQTW